MSERLSEAAPAKINLALHVRKRREDRYHELETLFAFARDGDVLEAAPADAVTLDIEGPFADGLDAGAANLVMRASRALRDRFEVGEGVALRLEKNLPVASGIGGGSADAAAALRLLCRLWALDPEDAAVVDIATSLGADVPACLSGEATFGTGRGDVLVPFANPFSGAPLLLVNPLVAVSTGTVFSGWDGVDRGALDITRPQDWRNDLTEPALRIAPVIGTVLDRLTEQSGATFVRMSGSGATCFGIFETDAMRNAAADAFPDCWTLKTRLS